LGGEKNAAGAMWMGYSIKMVAGQRTICCGNYRRWCECACGKCELESGHTIEQTSTKQNTVGSAGNNKVKLEAGPELTIYFFECRTHRLTRNQAGF